MKKLLVVTFILPFMFSCGKKEGKNEQTDIIEYNDQSNTSKETQTSTDKVINQIVIKASENMTYDVTKFTVKAGEEITLTLVNVGTSSKEAMGHNLVILKQGVDVNSFAFDASSEKANDYIPANATNDIVAHTKLLGPKENDQIKFKFDAPGTYTFICTFPGHAATMQGTITVL